MTARFTSAPGRFVTSAIALVLLVAAVLVGLVTSAQTAHAALPTGLFRQRRALRDCRPRRRLQFAPDGTIFVAEQAGKIFSYKSFTDTEPDARRRPELRSDHYGTAGLLGLAVPPNYPTDNHLYVLYTRDAPIGGTTPTWGDACPTPPGPNADGCVVSGRLSKLTLTNGVDDAVRRRSSTAGASSSRATRSARSSFGNDGYLYAGGGEGANFNAARLRPVRRHQPRRPANPCGDPPGGAGTALTPPTAEGGALRAQSALRTDGPTVLNGADHPGRSGDRCGRAHQPLRHQHRPQQGPGCSPSACATRSGSPPDRARTSSGSATSARSPGKRSTRFPTPPPAPR